MRTRSTIRRAALVCAGALAVLPLAAGPAAAQSAEDFCDEVPEELEPVFGPICEQLEDEGDDPEEGDDGDGPTGTPLDELLEALDPSQLQALCDEAPEELEAVFGPICDALADEEDEADPDPEPLPEEAQPDPEPEEPEPDPETVDADPGGELPMTGGGAGLLAVGLLGAGAALLRRKPVA